MFSGAQTHWSPNDWPDTLPELRTIDNLLRCSICFEYFDIAVMIQECSHNYCSLCIRKAMSYETHCPTCHVKASQQDLKCNRVLDEFVKNFINVREKLLNLLSEGVMKSQVPSTPLSKGKTPSHKTPLTISSKGKTRQSSRETPNRKRKRRKVIDSDDEDMDVEDFQIKQDPDWTMEEEEFICKSHKKRHSSGASTPRPPDFAECPVCGEIIQQNKINSHLDICLTREDKKESLRNKKEISSPSKKAIPSSTKQTSTSGVAVFNSTSGPPSAQAAVIVGSNAFISLAQKRKPLPKLVYTLLSDKQLKLKLKECGLSTQGAREKLIKKHKEFVTLYNAQCDSTYPKSAAAILKQMEQNEKMQNKLSKTSTEPAFLNFTKQSSEEEMETARQHCLKDNQGEFDKLINSIRNKRKKDARGSEKETSSNASTVATVEDNLEKDNNEIKDPKIQTPPRINTTSPTKPPNTVETIKQSTYINSKLLDDKQKKIDTKMSANIDRDDVDGDDIVIEITSNSSERDHNPTTLGGEEFRPLDKENLGTSTVTSNSSERDHDNPTTLGEEESTPLDKENLGTSTVTSNSSERDRDNPTTLGGEESTPLDKENLGTSTVTSKSSERDHDNPKTLVGEESTPLDKENLGTSTITSNSSEQDHNPTTLGGEESTLLDKENLGTSTVRCAVAEVNLNTDVEDVDLSSSEVHCNAKATESTVVGDQHTDAKVDQSSSEGGPSDDEDAELTPSLGLNSSDEEGESDDDAYSLQTSPVIDIGISRRSERNKK